MSTNRDRYPAWLQEELRDDIITAAADLGCEILEIGRSGPTLRLVIDHPEGVTHERCSDLSRQVSALLDLHDFGDSRYVLEVSSPGLDRKLYDAADYERFRGSLVRVRFRDRDRGGRATVVGRLLDLDAGTTVRLEPESASSPFSIPLADVEIARLEPSFDNAPQEAVKETT